MKKLFIGCGIVVLLIVGGLGYIAYLVYPQAKQMQVQWESALTRLNSLAHEHPFDPQAQSALPLDTQRFATSLDLRAALADDAQRTDAEMNAHGKGADGESKNPIQVFRAMLGTLANVLPNFATRLEDKQMSWPEFAWHTRLLWACLLRVDAGVGPPELERLRGSYGRLEEAYARVRPHGEAAPPKLVDLIGKFPAPLINEASALLVRDVMRVELGLSTVTFDHLYMQPISRLEDLQGVQLDAQERAGQRAGESADRSADDDTPEGLPPAGADDAGRSTAAPPGGTTTPADAPVPLSNDPPKPAPPAEPDKPGGK